MKKFIGISLSALMLGFSTAADTPHPPFVFTVKEDGYASYRIPAIIQSDKGTLLAFAEGRVKSAADHGDIDLVLRRSTDGGKTWGKLIVVRDDGKYTCGNPAPVMLADGKRIALVSCGSKGSESENMHKGVPREVYVQFSEDDGLTWSEARRITDEARAADWGWFATGPCNAIVIKKGKYMGRIVVPSNHSAKFDNKVRYEGSCFYSDDNGKTWKRGEETKGKLNANESSIAEVAPNLLLQSFRAQSGRGIRLQRYSKDGGATWTDEAEMPELPHIVCQGSLISDTEKAKVLYYSSPGVKKKRQNMTIFRTRNGGKSWPYAYCLREGSHGYSNLVDIDSKTLGILYESGGKDIKNDYSRGGIVFERLEKSKLNQKKQK